MSAPRRVCPSCVCHSSCTPLGCYEICCYLFSEGTLMRPPVISEVSPPGNTHKYELLCMSSTIFSRVWKISLLGGAQRTHADLAQHSAHHSPAHRDTCTYPTPPASSTSWRMHISPYTTSLQHIVMHAHITLHHQPPVHTKYRYTSCAPHTPEGLSL